MMAQWVEIPGLQGDVGCTSLVTRIAKNLGLLENASVIYITVPRWLIDYDYFNHAHMLKKGKDGKLVMMYMDYINEFPLPDRNLGLYVVDSFVFDLQKIKQAPHRSASMRITRNPSLDTVETTPFQKALSSPATQDLIKQDLPRCTILCMQVRTSRDLPVCSNLNMLGGAAFSASFREFLATGPKWAMEGRQF